MTMTATVSAVMYRLRPGWCVILAAAFFAPAAAYAQAPPAWPDTFVARLEALALIQTLNAEILTSPSSTRSLENWCRDHRLAAEPRILAHVVPGVNEPPTAEQRQRLEVTDQEEVRYRRVQLRCGTRVLSEADNWYVPGRLTPEMNRLLRTFAVTLLWAPLPDGWERESRSVPVAAGGALTIPDAVFEHRAVLYTREHKPFSEVREVYQRQLLAFPPPSSR